MPQVLQNKNIYQLLLAYGYSGNPVTDSAIQTLTNKTLDYNSNTFLNFPGGGVSPLVLTSNTTTEIPLSLVGHAGQTGNLLNLTSHGGSAGNLFSVDYQGDLAAVSASFGSLSVSGALYALGTTYLENHTIAFDNTANIQSDGAGNLTTAFTSLSTNSGKLTLDSNGNVITKGNLSFSSGGYIRFNGSSDQNWRMGLGINAFSTALVGATTSIQIITGSGSGGPDGFAIGQTGGNSIMELDGNTLAAYFRGVITASNFSGTSSNNNTGDQDLSSYAVAASYIGSSTIVTLGTISTGVWHGTVVTPAYGGTGVDNGSNNTITFSGNYTLGLTLTGNTSITLPTSGTLVNSAVSTLSSLTSVGTIATGVWQGTAIAASYISTLNQNTTGSAASLSISGQTALLTITGLTSTNRTKTVRDATDIILELGGSYSPSGTWTSITLVTPVLGTPTSGNLANCVFPTLNQNTSGTAAGLSATLVPASGGTGIANNNASTLTISGNYGTTLTLTNTTSITLPTSGTLVNNAVSTLSSLTSIGTIGTGIWQGTLIGSTYGGTGINNGSSTITIGGNLTLSGAYTFTGILTNNTSVTFPTSGTLINSVVSTLSSLTSIGTIATGTWQGTAVGIGYGGTGQTTASAAFNTLSPMTTAGDLIIGGVSGAGSRLAIGSTNYVLTVIAGTPTWAAASGGGGSPAGSNGQVQLYSGGSFAVGTYPLTVNLSTGAVTSVDNTLDDGSGNATFAGTIQSGGNNVSGTAKMYSYLNNGGF